MPLTHAPETGAYGKISGACQGPNAYTSLGVKSLMSSKSCLSCHTVHTAVEKYNQDDDVYSSKYTYSKQIKSLVTHKSQSDFQLLRDWCFNEILQYCTFNNLAENTCVYSNDACKQNAHHGRNVNTANCSN